MAFLRVFAQDKCNETNLGNVCLSLNKLLLLLMNNTSTVLPPSCVKVAKEMNKKQPGHTKE